MKLPSLEQLGLPGVAGLGVLLFCLSFYLGSIEPTQSELDELKQATAQLSAQLPPTAGGPPAASPTHAPPPLDMAADQLKQLNALAEQHGVQIERATYLLSAKNGQQRLEITLPIKASYPALRAYLRAVMAQAEPPTLDELTLQRQNTDDTQVDANLRLSSYFSSAPAAAPGHAEFPAAQTPTDIFAAKNWAPPPPPVVETAPPPPPAPEAPPLPFRYLGRLDESGKAPIFFLARGEEILPVRSGQVIDGIYRVGKADSKQLSFTYLPLKTRQFLAVGSNS